MGSRIVCRLLPLLLLLLEGIAAAAEPRLTLSLEDAIARAETQSPLIRRADRNQEVVAALRTGAALVLPSNPTAAVALGDRRDKSSSVPLSQGLEWGVRVEQAVEIAGQRSTRLAEVAQAMAAAKARAQLARIETRARVRAAYFGVLIAEAQAKSARHREELAEQVLASARARVQAGAAAVVETNLAVAEVGRAQHERIEADLGVGDARRGLSRLLGLPDAAIIQLASPLALPPLPVTPLPELVAAAQSRRQEVQMLEANKSQLDAMLVRLRREVVPSPTLFVEVQQQQPGQLYVGSGLGLSLPLWRRNQGEIAVTRAERRRIEEEQSLLEQEIALEVSALYRSTFARHQQATLWKSEIVPAIESNLDLVGQGWRAGKFDLFRVVQVAREAAEAQRKQLEALGSLWQSVIELDRAVGRP